MDRVEFENEVRKLWEHSDLSVELSDFLERIKVRLKQGKGPHTMRGKDLRIQKRLDKTILLADDVKRYDAPYDDVEIVSLVI